MLASGHVTIDIMEFAAEGFEVSDVKAPCCTAEFGANVTAMLAQNELKCTNAVLENRPKCFAQGHVGAGRAIGGKSSGVPRHPRWNVVIAQREQFETGESSWTSW